MQLHSVGQKNVLSPKKCLCHNFFMSNICSHEFVFVHMKIFHTCKFWHVKNCLCTWKCFHCRICFHTWKCFHYIIFLCTQIKFCAWNIVFSQKCFLIQSIFVPNQCFSHKYFFMLKQDHLRCPTWPSRHIWSTKGKGPPRIKVGYRL